MSLAELQGRLDALGARGAARTDAMRLAQLRALYRRLAAQPEPVRALLQARLERGVAQLEQRQGATVSAAPIAPIRTAPRRAPSPWPALPQPARELASALRFRRVWSNTRAQDSVALAAAQRPANAGPLNSQVLMLQSLDLMAQLSPDYLRRFVAHAESLLWLQEAAGKRPPAKRAGKR
jgi:hypothetical protein